MRVVHLLSTALHSSILRIERSPSRQLSAALVWRVDETASLADGASGLKVKLFVTAVLVPSVLLVKGGVPVSVDDFFGELESEAPIALTAHPVTTVFSVEAFHVDLLVSVGVQVLENVEFVVLVDCVAFRLFHSDAGFTGSETLAIGINNIPWCTSSVRVVSIASWHTPTSISS